MEAIYLGLRTRSGIDVEEFNQKFKLDFLRIFQETIAELENEGLIRTEQNRVRLSRKGMSFLENVTAMFTNQEIYPQ
jgi:oxygen-independent coproporphyrinogen-3 oxidase